MTDPLQQQQQHNLLLSPPIPMTDLLSKSSPSQLQGGQPFQYNRSCTVPILPTEAFFVSSQLQQQQQKQQQLLLNQQNSLKPSNLSHVPCKFFKQGTCTAGANCTFSHSSDLSSESAVCKYFVKGNCKFGTKCALLHTMSPFGTSSSSSTTATKRTNMIVGTPPQPGAVGPLGIGNRRKTTSSDQMMTTGSLDHRSFLNDPFGTSAPASLLFQQQQDVWARNNRSPRTVSTNEATTDYLLGTSPFSNNRGYSTSQQLSSSLRSNGGGGSYFNSIPTADSSSYRRLSYLSPPVTATATNNDQYEEDLNDAMLPSSLNDLFTPTELHVRRVRQQQQAYPMSNDSLFLSNNNLSSNIVSPPTLIDTQQQQQRQQQQWRVPFLTKSTQSDYTGAINIPSNNIYSNGGSTSNGSGNSASSASYLQQQQYNSNIVLEAGGENDGHDHTVEEEYVQFFMEDDTFDNKQQQQQQKSNSYGNYPSLVSLPTPST